MMSNPKEIPMGQYAEPHRQEYIPVIRVHPDPWLPVCKPGIFTAVPLHGGPVKF